MRSLLQRQRKAKEALAWALADHASGLRALRWSQPHA